MIESDLSLQCRYVRYEEVTENGETNPERLPPTERAAFYYTLHVHLQMILWGTLDANFKDPLDWAWAFSHGTFKPVLMSLKIAPDARLDPVRCQLKKVVPP